MRSGWRRAYTTIYSGSYSTRLISTWWAATRAIVANTTTTATIPVTVTWIEDGVTTQASGRVSVFVQKSIEKRSLPPPHCGVVRTELGAEFPIGPAEAPFFRLTRHSPRPQRPIVHVRLPIGAEFSKIERAVILFGPCRRALEVVAQLLPLLRGAHPSCPTPGRAVVEPEGALVRELERLVVVKRADNPPILRRELYLVQPIDGIPMCWADQDYSVWVAVTNGLGQRVKSLLPALIIELVVRLVQELEHKTLGLIAIAQRDLFPEFHQTGKILDRILVHLYVVMDVDDGGQIPRQRLPNGPIDALEEPRFDVVGSGGAGMRRPAGGNAYRIEPRLPYQAKIVGLERDTPGSLMWCVQGIPEINASAEQAIIPKGVVVLRDCRHAGCCCKQCDAEDTAGHATDNRKHHGTEYHWDASVAGPELGTDHGQIA